MTITHKNRAVFFNVIRTWLQVQDFSEVQEEKITEIIEAAIPKNTNLSTLGTCNLAFTYNTTKKSDD